MDNKNRRSVTSAKGNSTRNTGFLKHVTFLLMLMFLQGEGIKLSGTQFVDTGATIDLNCTATDIDYRPKGVDWFKDGTRVKPGGRTSVTEHLDSETNVLHSRLEIERVGEEDAGTYICRFSRHQVESIKVIVLKKTATPQALVGDKGIQITHQIDTDAVLTCTVQDLGNRRIIWSKLSEPYPISVGSTRFSPSKRYKVAVTGNTSVLTIKQVKLQDAGEYQCRVSGMEFLLDTLTLNIQAADAENTYLLPSETEIKAEVGTTVRLPCRVENLKSHVVLWMDSQNDVLSLRTKIINEDRRLSVWHPTKTEWSLQIKNVRVSDFGLYTCAINSVPVLTRTVRLVNSAPVELAPALIQDSTFKKRVQVAGGETVTLTCNFKASPPANITWYRRETVNDKTVKTALGSGNTYTLLAVNPGQSGHYICEGDNGVKPIGRGKIQLTVIGAPTPTPTLEPTTFVAVAPISPVLYPGPRKVGQRVGRQVELTCSSIGNPRPEMHWSRKQERIANNYKYEVSEHHYRHDTTHIKLEVKGIQRADMGEYTCVAYNNLGLQTVSFEIYVLPATLWI